MDRQKSLKRIFSRCADDLDEHAELTDAPVEDKDIIRVLAKYVAPVSELLVQRGYGPISEEEQKDLLFRLGQRRVAVNKSGETIVVEGEDARAEPWLEDAEVEWRFWDNYSELLRSEGKSPEVIQNHEIAIERILELSGNPIAPNRAVRLRRGLVMGNVQSGKTLNFIGLLNKALDVGYHTIIVLGGHMNELREQAQGRIDVGVVEVHREKIAYHQGLNYPHALTTKAQDFLKSTALAQSPNLNVSPAVYVVKKHPGILERLENWFTTEGRETVLSKPLLLIDDEADYASINTLQSRTNFTRTNDTIRKLLRLFDTSTYVAYTATPFANVFIPFRDQESREEIDDLFPADFMIKMPIPENYVGQDFFFRRVREDGESSVGPCRMLDIKDHEEWLKLVHKKDVVVNGLYWQLEDAIRLFLCVIALRHLRGFANTHNTMLVNVSRFNLVQQSVALNIQDMLDNVEAQLRAYGALGESHAVKQSAEIASLRRVFKAELSDAGYAFSDVLNFLAEQSRRRFVSVALVNGESKKKTAGQTLLDYEGNKEKGLWVIAVGGLKLSRGLTLEGLSVSYFFRNALAYDTLTQMCRWFGYRDGYQDLCRLFLLEQSYDHYCDVAGAIRGLYDDLKLMQLSNGTPRDFGLRVKNSDTALMITAKNKLGSAKPIPFSLKLWGAEVSSFRMHSSDEKNTRHYMLVEAMIRGLEQNPSENKSIADNGSVIFDNVSYGDIFKFISEMTPIFSELRFQKPPILRAVEALDKARAARPKVILFSRSSDTRPYAGIDRVKTADGAPVSTSPELNVSGNEIRMITRAMSVNKRGEIYSRNKLIGDSDDLRILYSDEDLKRLHAGLDGAIQNKHIREGLLRTPVLVIYLFRAVVNSDGEKRLAHSRPSVAFALHFPAKRADMPHVEEMESDLEYLINEVLQGVTIDDAQDEDHEDEEQLY